MSTLLVRLYVYGDRKCESDQELLQRNSLWRCSRETRNPLQNSFSPYTVRSDYGRLEGTNIIG